MLTVKQPHFDTPQSLIRSHLYHRFPHGVARLAETFPFRRGMAHSYMFVRAFMPVHINQGLPLECYPSIIYSTPAMTFALFPVFFPPTLSFSSPQETVPTLYPPRSPRFCDVPVGSRPMPTTLCPSLSLPLACHLSRALVMYAAINQGRSGHRFVHQGHHLHWNLLATFHATLKLLTQIRSGCWPLRNRII